MPTDLENLTTIRSTLIAELAAGDTKPDYSIDGQAVSWTAYRASLWKELESLNRQIAAAGGPFEEAEEAFT